MTVEIGAASASLPNRKPDGNAAALDTIELWKSVASSPAGPTKGDAKADEATKGTTPSKRARILLLTGNDYPGHKWRETAPLLARQIGADPRLSVEVVEDPKFLASEKLKEFDAIVLHYMNWETPDPGPEARENLRSFVDGGKGLVLVHFACGAFQGWDEFRNLAGKVYDPKLRGHDPHGAFTVEISGIDHPVTRGLKPFETVDELYTCLAGERPVEVLATAKSKVDGKDYPMAFAFSYGKGRVLHSPLGHDVRAFETPGVGELFRRACAWVAGLPPVTEEARSPKEKPSESK